MPERYWRFVPSIRNCQLAELVFRDAEGRVLTGRLIGPDVVRGEKLFDNDPLTYTYIDQWIGIGFRSSAGCFRNLLSAQERCEWNFPRRSIRIILLPVSRRLDFCR